LAPSINTLKALLQDFLSIPAPCHTHRTLPELPRRGPTILRHSPIKLFLPDSWRSSAA
jgi:hypothetical protein